MSVTVIRPRRGLRRLSLAELWTNREVMFALVSRDLKLRYRQTLLGVIWVFIQPLASAGILAFVFGSVAGLRTKGVSPFAVSLTGMCVWTSFASIVTRGSSSLVSNPALVTRVFVSRVVIPTSIVLAVAVDAGITLGTLTVIGLISGWIVGPQILLAPLILLGPMAFGWGLSFITSPLMVRYRDVTYFVPLAMQIWMYASPVAYTLASVHVSKTLLYLSPMTPYIEAFRWSVIGTPAPSLLSIGLALLSTALILAVGLTFFRSQEGSLADVM